MKQNLAITSLDLTSFQHCVSPGRSAYVFSVALILIHSLAHIRYVSLAFLNVSVVPVEPMRPLGDEFGGVETRRKVLSHFEEVGFRLLLDDTSVSDY